MTPNYGPRLGPSGPLEGTGKSAHSKTEPPLGRAGRATAAKHTPTPLFARGATAAPGPRHPGRPKPGVPAGKSWAWQRQPRIPPDHDGAQASFSRAPIGALPRPMPLPYPASTMRPMRPGYPLTAARHGALAIVAGERADPWGWAIPTAGSGRLRPHKNLVATTLRCAGRVEGRPSRAPGLPIRSHQRPFALTRHIDGAGRGHRLRLGARTHKHVSGSGDPPRIPVGTPLWRGEIASFQGKTSRDEPGSLPRRLR